jgi:4-deoxy-L-threo-5-hexosulose-uronate ketol-isomerase
MLTDAIRRMPRPQETARMNTQELRDTFLVTDLFQPGKLNGVFTDLDRLVVAGAVPQPKLTLENHKETGRSFFLEARELGALNIGGPGKFYVDGKTFEVGHLDCAYAGCGTREVVFESCDPKNPARFYVLSCPAHAGYPAAVMKQNEASPVPLGEVALANKRTIYKFIHPGGIKSCQLVMGFTEFAEGSVWNTFPPHTHNRRTEVYLYFDLGERPLVHLMGEATETRHLFVQQEQVVLSPAWSIHAGCGFGSYRFCWAMAGENQRFDDMDFIPALNLR